MVLFSKSNLTDTQLYVFLKSIIFNNVVTFTVSCLCLIVATTEQEDSYRQDDLARTSNTNTELSENEFLKVFNLPPIDDPEVKEIQAKALKQRQQEVLENNRAYQALTAGIAG